MPKAPDPIDVKVGTKIRARRLLVGMTQEALAAILGITFQQIQKYEKGTNRVSASRLQNVADALHVPVWYFFPDNGHAAQAAATSDDEIALFLKSNEGRDLNVAFALIKSPDVRRRIVGLVKSLAREAEKTQSAAT